MASVTMYRNYGSEPQHLRPAGFLVENTGLLPRGRALDVAMGRGRNAIYLAHIGFDVEGVDCSAEAVQEALARAGQEGVSIKAWVDDLEKIPYFDEETYDLVICFNYLQRSLIPQMKNWVRTGGMVVYETYIVDQAQFGRPRNPDHLLRHNELLHMFCDFRVLRYHEGVIDGKRAVAGIAAQKVRLQASPTPPWVDCQVQNGGGLEM